MEKIDRLVWAAGISCVAHGARIGIRVNEPTILERVRQHLPPGWRPVSRPVVESLYSLIVGSSSPGSNVRRYHLLYAGAARLARTMELDEVFQTLESNLHFNVAVGAKRRLFVHAGVVGWNGRAIVIPGLSRSGKTTLVAELVRAGATYYSDEYAVFDTQGRVHPYPKPLSIREEPDKPGKPYPVEAFGGSAGTRPLPVGLVAVMEYHSGAKWRPRALTPGEAMLALLANTVLARSRPELALATFQHVVPTALTLKGRRGEAHAVVRSLLDRSREESLSAPGIDSRDTRLAEAVA
jgi:hypothetical protein